MFGYWKTRYQLEKRITEALRERIVAQDRLIAAHEGGRLLRITIMADQEKIITDQEKIIALLKSKIGELEKSLDKP